MRKGTKNISMDIAPINISGIEVFYGSGVCWWLSFADGELPKGEQFLGACIIEADENFTNAVSKAHFLGINPGGSVRAVKCGEKFVQQHVRPETINRLMSHQELEDLGLGPVRFPDSQKEDD